MITKSVEIKTKIFLELTEGEAGALDAICGYGPERFIEWFEKNLGKHYIAPYKPSLQSLFEKARKLHHEVEGLQKLRSQINKLTNEQ